MRTVDLAWYALIMQAKTTGFKIIDQLYDSVCALTMVSGRDPTRFQTSLFSCLYILATLGTQCSAQSDCSNGLVCHVEWWECWGML